jgi:23S rRNA pseudouridine1911/1915/1917 synthase
LPTKYFKWRFLSRRYVGTNPLPGTMVRIIFQNKNFVVVDKPAGLAVHRGIGMDGKTLVDNLVEKFPEMKDVGDDPSLRPGIVHRLDKDTSGVMVVARNQPAFEYLKKQFKDRKVEKKYAALVYGKLKNKEGKIEGEMGRSRRDFRKQALVRGKISVRKERYSLTFYKVLEERGKYSLLEVNPKTGRMHQIRVHLHSIGYPIVGDRKYTFKKYKHENSNQRMFLHAWKLSFIGEEGRKYSFESPVPTVFAAIS